ncbi:DUF4249 family protein [Robertkochia solimangrovi]|uniref:DUF4249 family protein n=1 Tax=Robertkochia solimangrovi TaxID=2213046 RepID=UPI0011812961|nr:DUF4249 family protein [Robertkochia solimangrovi]TRZ41605.1 DUF4249 domain-containing protein [Robertkochia solimangrovi]
MKYQSLYRNLFFALFMMSVMTSCEDVIDADLESGDARLVIDAEILWFDNTDGSQQTIKISRLTDYYNESTTKVSGASVKVTDANDNEFLFSETSESGTYHCTDFIPVLNAQYYLEVIVDDETYTATEIMVPSPEIKRIEQRSDGGFLNEDLEVSIYYDDAAGEVNSYLTDFNAGILNFPQYVLSNDDFFNGNEMEEHFSHEDLEPGQVVEINFRGISLQTFNYMELILQSASANPFGTPPSNVRGNFINETDPENYAYGYFRLSQARKVVYILE